MNNEEDCPCGDCGLLTAQRTDRGRLRGRWEWYQVHHALWRTAMGDRPVRFLCVGCLETRLRRRLVPGDFTPAPINQRPDDGDWAYSWRTERMRDRLGHWAGATP